MSKYTTEVRFICETEAGLSESGGYNSVDNIIATSAPKIFNFDFPIFDENYRLPLETKILRHFYTREICEETVGLWKLRLEDKLNLIMPYYNQLYNSELIKFNPLYDVDLTTERSVNTDGTEDVATTGYEGTNLTKNKTVSETGSKNTTNTVDTDTTNTGVHTDAKNFTGDTVDKTDENGAKTSDSESDKNSSSDSSKTNTENVNKTVNTEATNEESQSRTSETTETNAKDVNSSSSNVIDTDTTNRNTNTGSSSGTSVRDTDVVGTKNNTRWDLYSDTPQGGINGITNDSDSVSNNTYLTNARKITDSENTTENTDESITNTQSSTVTDNGSGTVDTSETGSVDTSESGSRNVDVVDSSEQQNHNIGSTDEVGETLFSERDNANVDEHSEITVSETDNKTVDYTSRKETNESGTVNIDDSGTIDTYETGTENTSGELKESDVIGGNNSSNGTSKTVLTNLQTYSEHVLGKQNGLTYSKMLIEFRETFLNIDSMVIEELNDLFFNLW